MINGNFLVNNFGAIQRLVLSIRKMSISLIYIGSPSVSVMTVRFPYNFLYHCKIFMIYPNIDLCLKCK